MSTRRPSRSASRKVRTLKKVAAPEPDARAESSAVFDPAKPPPTPDALHRLLERMFDIHVARLPLLPSSGAPFDYLVHTFFEGKRFGRSESTRDRTDLPGAGPCHDVQAPAPAPIDAVVWANRGGGKTFLGAVATMLDAVFKPGIEIRILGGSLEQSRRMHDHLRRLFDHDELKDLLAAAPTEKGLTLLNGSRVEILSQSERAVRGTRVQKLRCDEVDLFDREVWEAAQLTTRSMRLSGPWGQWVRGSVEALSTMHRPYGIMWEIAGDAAIAAARKQPVGEGDSPNAPPARGSLRPRTLFRWGVVDVLRHCEPERACATCALEPECAGRAKTRPKAAAGHVEIDDALAMKARVGRHTWEAEMLCLRPRRDSSVIPEFDPKIHVYEDAPGSPSAQCLMPSALPLCGMDFGFRAPTVILWGSVDDSGILRITHERVETGAILKEHIEALMRSERPRPAWVGVDPAGAQRNSQTGLSNIDAMRKAGLIVRQRVLGVLEGVGLIRTRLGPNGEPRLFVHARCTKLIESLHRYHYDENRPESLEPVKDGHDHAVDALRYLVVNLDKPHTTVASNYLYGKGRGGDER